MAIGHLDKVILEEFYFRKGKSMQEIAWELKCSLHKVKYWMEKHGFKARSRSEATYLKRNPDGDPFKLREPKGEYEHRLFGMGIGLYWGEGTKANKNSIRLGNTDPELIRKFMEFLVRFCGVKKEDLYFGLQIFSDISPNEALDFWVKKLKIRKGQIGRPIVTKSGSLGTYRKKSPYGVLTVMYHNKKLRDWLVGKLPSRPM